MDETLLDVHVDSATPCLSPTVVNRQTQQLIDIVDEPVACDPNKSAIAERHPDDPTTTTFDIPQLANPRGIRDDLMMVDLAAVTQCQPIIAPRYSTVITQQMHKDNPVRHVCIDMDLDENVQEEEQVKTSVQIASSPSRHMLETATTICEHIYEELQLNTDECHGPVHAKRTDDEPQPTAALDEYANTITSSILSMAIEESITRPQCDVSILTEYNDSSIQYTSEEMQSIETESAVDAAGELDPIDDEPHVAEDSVVHEEVRNETHDSESYLSAELERLLDGFDRDLDENRVQLATAVAQPNPSIDDTMVDRQEADAEQQIEMVHDTDTAIAVDPTTDVDEEEVYYDVDDSAELSTAGGASSTDGSSTAVGPVRSLIASERQIDEQLWDWRLTDAERQLGKVRPFWIPDKDAAACMLCARPFTFVTRRHHCRSCGRVLCRACCAELATLAYAAQANKPEKVCAPCAATLERIRQFEDEEEQQAQERLVRPGYVLVYSRNALVPARHRRRIRSAPKQGRHRRVLRMIRIGLHLAKVMALMRFAAMSSRAVRVNRRRLSARHQECAISPSQ